MADHDDAAAVVLDDRPQVAAQRTLPDDVQACAGLVEDEIDRFHRQDGREQEPLLLAVAQVEREVGGMTGQVEVVEVALGAFHGVCFVQTEVAQAAGDLLEDARTEELARRVLTQVADALRDLGHGQCRRVEAVDQDAPARRSFDADDELGGGGLPTPVVARDGGKRACREGGGEALKDRCPGMFVGV